jgi:WD40 repeat protein
VTVIGIEQNGLFLIKENLKTKKSISFSKLHSAEICTISVNEKLNLVLSTSNDHRVIQYNMNSGEIVHNYGIINLGYISSCKLSNYLAVLGGWNHKFGLLDLKSKIIYDLGLQTSAYSVYSIQIFKKNKNQMCIVLSGGFIDYEKGKSDILELNMVAWIRENCKIISESNQLNRK